MSTTYLQIDTDFRIAVSSQFTLQRRAIITPKGGTPRTDWKDNGFHGSMVCALKGYVRHTLDACTTVTELVNKQDEIEANIKKICKAVR